MKEILIPIILLLNLSVFGQVKEEVYPTENETVEILLSNPAIKDMANLIKEFKKLDEKLNQANAALVRLSKLYISSEGESKIELQERVDNLLLEIDEHVLNISGKQSQIIALNNLLKHEESIKEEYQMLYFKYKFDFEELSKQNFKKKNEAFLNNIKYNIEVVSQNIMETDENILFSTKGVIIKKYNEPIEPKNYDEILLSNCKYRIPTLMTDEVDFEEECIFIIYDENGRKIQAAELKFEIDQTSPNPYTKTYSIMNDLDKKVKVIPLDEKIRTKKINVHDYKFLVVEEAVYNENISKFNYYKKAINQKVILSNDLELASKSLDNISQLTNCKHSYEISVENSIVEIKIFDNNTDDNDRVLYNNSNSSSNQEVTLSTSGTIKNIRLDYITTLRFTPTNTGDGKCTLGIKVNGKESIIHNLDISETVCIEIIKN